MKQNGVVRSAIALVQRAAQFDPQQLVTLRTGGAELLGRVGKVTESERMALEHLVGGGELRPDDKVALMGLEDRGTFTRVEERLLGVVWRLCRYGPARSDTPEDPNVMRAIGEAAATVTVQQMLHEKALDTLILARDAHRKAKTLREVEQGLADMQAAESQYQAARTALESAQAVLANLQLKRATARRAAAMG